LLAYMETQGCQFLLVNIAGIRIRTKGNITKYKRSLYASLSDFNQA